MPESKSHILVVNSGSSSVKLSLFDRSKAGSAKNALLSSENHNIKVAEASDEELLEILVKGVEKAKCSADDIGSVAHRVVHGGAQLRSTCFVDENVEAQIESLCELAPVHNPIALRLIKQSRSAFAKARQIAVFDTAFHKTIKEENFLYAIPYEWYEKFGIRKFGFHGINHKFCAEQAKEILQSSDATKKVVTCHLGNGCSVAAIENGLSINTSMGFTPLEGLMMGSRSGSIDPGIIFYLMKKSGLSADEIENNLDNSSGLKGVSGISKDIREIEKAMLEGNARAKLAFEMFVQHVMYGIAEMAASMNGINSLVFTGGIGEHSSSVREAVCNGLTFLGISLDKTANKNCNADSIISESNSAVTVLRIEAREDLQIFQECNQLLSTS